MGGNLERGLLELGLEKRDAKVYASVLLLKSSTAYSVAKDTGIPPRSVYDSLNGLQEKGLVTFSSKNGKKYYQPASLAHLKNLISEKSEILKSLLPTISGLKKEANFESVIYTGVGGLRTLLDDMLDSTPKGESVLGIGDNGKIGLHFLPAFMEKWHEQRIENKMQFKSIFCTVPEAPIRFKQVKGMPLTNVRVMPFKSESYGAIWVYSDKMLVSDMRDKPVVVMVQNKGIKNIFENHFNFLWLRSKLSFGSP